MPATELIQRTFQPIGREERRSTWVAQAREPDLNSYYRYTKPPIHPGEFRFELTLLRPKQPPLSLDTMVDQLDWVDEQAALSGTLSAHRPRVDDALSLPIARGHLVRCRAHWDGPTYELWTMRCDPPQREPDTGILTVNLTDDLIRLEAGTRDWIFRKTKHRPHGYSANEVAVQVAAALGVGVGEIAKGTTRFSLIKRRASGLDAVRAAYQNEKQASGRSFIVRLRNGHLEVVPLARNPLLYVLAAEIQTALITEKAGTKVPTTVLTGRGRLGVGKGAKKISFTASDRSIVDAYGAVQDTKDYGTVSSHAELRARTTRDLAAGLRMNDTVTVTHQGIPFIARGDGVQLDLPLEGYKGAQSFVYATRASHSVRSSVYTSSWDFTLADPYLAQWQAAQKATRQRAAKRATRTRPKVYG